MLLSVVQLMPVDNDDKDLKGIISGTDETHPQKYLTTERSQNRSEEHSQNRF